MKNQNDNLHFCDLQQGGFQFLSFWRRSGPSSPCGSSGVSLGQQVTNGSDMRSLTRFFLSSPINWNLWRSARHKLAPWPEPRGLFDWTQLSGEESIKSGWEWFLDDGEDGKKAENETDDRPIFYCFKDHSGLLFSFLGNEMFLQSKAPFYIVKCLLLRCECFTDLDIFFKTQHLRSLLVLYIL